MKLTLHLSMICIVALSNSGYGHNVTLEFLQGQWSLVSISRIEQMVAEEYVEPLPDDNIWIFHGDTCSRFNYPFAFLSESQIQIDSDYVNLNGVQWKFFTTHQDSSFLYAGVNHVLLKFHRDTLSANINHCLTILRRDTINPGLLIGKYTMITHFVPEDEAPFDLFPPVKMKSVISVEDSASARRIIHSRTIKLSVNGALQEFHIKQINPNCWSEWFSGETPIPCHCSPEITITPGKWWSGEIFEVHYKTKEK
jgi:hypothetical protein